MNKKNYQKISHILVYFNANDYNPDKMLEDIQLFDKSFLEETKNEMIFILRNDEFDKNDFYYATACEARNKESARQFFKDVYAYAFEGGEEPDVRDYWNR